ncbi:MAG: hypothetical protein Q7T80_14560 [Methanoregula sp.]|nr:hypothetical protein [Methanoregula sp.]
MYTGTSVTCSGFTTRIASGNFTPSDDATYFANATVLYTAPSTVNGVEGTQKYAIATMHVGTSGTTKFYVFAEGVGNYHGTQPDLSQGNKIPGDFYNVINGKCGAASVDPDKCWTGRGLNVDDNAGSKHWSSSEEASSYTDNADISLFVGHGDTDRIYFGTENSVLELTRPDMKLMFSPIAF